MECVVGDALISSLKLNKAESYRCHAREDAIVFCVMFLTDSSRDTLLSWWMAWGWITGRRGGSACFRKG